MESVTSKLKSIDLLSVVNIEIGQGELLIDTKPKAPAMVNKLIKVKLPSHVSSTGAVRELKCLIRRAEIRKEERRREAIREHRREEAGAGNI